VCRPLSDYGEPDSTSLQMGSKKPIHRSVLAEALESIQPSVPYSDLTWQRLKGKAWKYNELCYASHEHYVNEVIPVEAS